MRVNPSEARLQLALQQSWSADTSYSPQEWTPKNPARGECQVSSLVVQELLGGELARVKTTYKGQLESHYFNILPDGRPFDTTRSQYPEDAELVPYPVNLDGHPTVREKLLADPDTSRRYELLRTRVTQVLAKTI